MRGRHGSRNFHQPKDRVKGGEGSGGIVYASCTSMLVAIETVFQAIINKNTSSSGISLRGGGGYVIASLPLHKQTFDMIVFNTVNILMRGGGGLEVLPQKNLGLIGVKLCNSRHHKH